MMIEEIDFEKLIENKLDTCSKYNLHLYFGKKRREKNETIYTFYQTFTNENVREYLLTFFIKNFNKLKNDYITTVINEDNPNNYLAFNIEGLNVWKQFESCIYSDIQKFKDVNINEIQKNKKNIYKTNSLKNLKNNLNHYLLINESEDCIYGQISRMSASKIISSKGKIRCFFEGDKFTEVKTEENIELTERDSVLFYIDKEHKIGFTNNIKEYDEIFDMNEQYENNAINLIDNSDFKNYCDVDSVKRIIKKDRTIQRMLNRDITVYAFKNFNINDIIHSFDKFNEFKVSDNFSINFDNNQFIIDENNEITSLRNIIKFIGHYYNQSLDGNYLVEGTPKGFINAD